MQSYADGSPTHVSPAQLERRISSLPVLHWCVTVVTRQPGVRGIRGIIGMTPTLRLLTAALLAAVALGSGVCGRPIDANVRTPHEGYTDRVHARQAQHLDTLYHITSTHQQAPPSTTTPTDTDTPADHPQGASSPAADVRSALVGQTEVTWEGDWEHDAENSSENQVALSWVDLSTGQFAIVTYSERTETSFDSADAAVDSLATAIFDDPNATDVVAAGSGTLENGSVWKAFSFNFMGVPLMLLVAVSETPDGGYAISTMTGSKEGFPSSITLAQQEIALDRKPTFLEGLDVDLVSPVSDEQGSSSTT